MVFKSPVTGMPKSDSVNLEHNFLMIFNWPILLDFFQVRLGHQKVNFCEFLEQEFYRSDSLPTARPTVTKH